jgi:threonine synthase
MKSSLTRAWPTLPVLAIGQEEKDALAEDAFTVQAAQNVVRILGLDRKDGD